MLARVVNRCVFDSCCLQLQGEILADELRCRVQHFFLEMRVEQQSVGEPLIVFTPGFIGSRPETTHRGYDVFMFEQHERQLGFQTPCNRQYPRHFRRDGTPGEPAQQPKRSHRVLLLLLEMGVQEMGEIARGLTQCTRLARRFGKFDVQLIVFGFE